MINICTRRPLSKKSDHRAPSASPPEFVGSQNPIGTRHDSPSKVRCVFLALLRRWLPHWVLRPDRGSRSTDRLVHTTVAIQHRRYDGLPSERGWGCLGG